MTLRVEVIRDDGAFAALAREWDDLVERAAIQHPFLRYDWVRTWWECFGSRRLLDCAARPLQTRP